MSLDKAWEDVRKFHITFDHPYENKPTLIDQERSASRASWMNEEIEEFLEATTVVDKADAMIDLIYFALGTLVELGVRPQAIFDIVQQANMSKVWEDGSVHRREDGKVMKPPGWVAPEPLIAAEIQRQFDNNDE